MYGFGAYIQAKTDLQLPAYDLPAAGKLTTYHLRLTTAHC